MDGSEGKADDGILVKKISSKKRSGRQKSKKFQETCDRWLMLQMLLIFAISFGAGMIFIQGTILWHQYKHGYGYWATYGDLDDILRDRILSRLADEPSIYQWSHGQLRVNTSLFVH